MRTVPRDSAVRSPADAEIRIGISSCLLGEEVRHDGGHKRQPFLLQTVSRFVTFVPVCPELEMGLGAPREALRLAGRVDSPRLTGTQTGTDRTAALRRFAGERLRRLERENLRGYIFKSRSPSCGLHRVKVYGTGQRPARGGRGLFAAAVTERWPQLPVEEEARLDDPRLRENFFVRVFAYARLEKLFSGRWRLGDLVAFHTAEKLLLLAHDRPAHTRLGRLVADAKNRSRTVLAREYRSGFMSALGKLATTRKHTDVLQHMTGHFKKTLAPGARTELRQVIEDYRTGRVPLIVPVTLIRHHARALGVEYLAAQTYLNAHPKEMMLRNHV